MNFSVIRCFFIGLLLSLSFSSKAQSQQWNYYWSYYNPGTSDYILVYPSQGATDGDYLQQVLKASINANRVSSCESISISLNDPSAGNVSGPTISNYSNSTVYAYPVKGVKCTGQVVSTVIPIVYLSIQYGIKKFVCDPGNVVTFYPNLAASCGPTPQSRLQLNSNAGQSVLPVATSDCFVCKPGINNQSGYVGDPINIVTGNVYESEIDYVGFGSNKLKLSRSYNSIPSISSRPGMNIGMNWLLNYDRRVESVSANVAIVTMEDGSYLSFTKTGTNTYSPELAGRTEVLTFVSATGTVGWRLKKENGDVETYVPSGNGGFLSSVDFMTGGGIDILWNASAITGISDRNGHTIQFTRTNGLISKITLPDGSFVSYTYDSYRRLTSVIYPNGSSKIYEYSAPLINSIVSPYLGLLTRIQDQDGLTSAAFTYDNSGRAISSTGPLNHQKVSLVYGTDSTQVTNSLGLTETHEFYSPTGSIKQSNKRTSTCVDCFANAVVVTTNHDSNGNVTASSDKDGRLSCSTYDTSRNLITSKVMGLIDGIHTCGGSYGSTPVLAYNWAWHPTYAVTTAFSEPNRVTLINRDANLRPLSITEYATNDNTGLSGILSASVLATLPSRTTSYTYLPTGEVTSVKSPRNDINSTTSFTYDANRNLTSVTTPTGLVTSFSNYYPIGLPGTVTLPNGATISMSYDYAGRVLQSNYAGAVTSYSYTPAGRLSSKTEPSGLTTSFGYDIAGRLVQISDNAGNSIQYTLDSEGNIVSQKTFGAGGSLAGSLTSTYNSLSRLMSVVSGAQ